MRFGLIGRMEGNLRAARAYIYATAARPGARPQTGKITEDHRMAMRLAATWTIHQAASVVDAAYHMAGATAVFRANKFERRFRDMHAIAQQIQARDNHYEDVGRMLLDSSATIPRGPTNQACIGKLMPSDQRRLSRVEQRVAIAPFGTLSIVELAPASA